MTAAGVELVFERVFDAPRPLVFDAWTEASHFSRWFGPHGSTMPFCRIEARPGGFLHFQHRLPDGQDVWIKGLFRELVRPERIVFTVQFSNEAGDEVRRPGYIRENVIAITFRDEGRGTHVTVRHTGLPADQGESAGWQESLDRFGEYVKEKP